MTTLFVSTSFECDSGEPIPSGATYTPGGTSGGGLLTFVPGYGSFSAGVWTFESGAGDAELTITDSGSVGDVFEVIVDGTSIGWTSEVEVFGATHSTRTWTVPLTAGTHTIEIWDITLSYIDELSPFGGTELVGEDFSPAGGSFVFEYESPEAATRARLYPINTPTPWPR